MVSMTAFKGITEAIEWLLMAYNTAHSLLDKAPPSLKEKLPMFLGLSYEDERVWADIWPALDAVEQKNITDFLGSIAKHERNSFRYVIIGMPKREVKKTVPGSGKGGKDTTTIETESRAVAFLKCLSGTITTVGIDEAKRQCIMGNLINADAISAKMAQKWHEGLEWLQNHQQEVIDFAKEKCLLFDAKLGVWADEINTTTTSMPKHQGHLRGIFGNWLGGILEKIFC
ncbi:MAG: hypothetical protein Q7T51_01535 [Candidatus Moranbacteria bacterium]|nr:hypothetical protein [Candidatus Moranbacteria bacterium]